MTVGTAVTVGDLVAAQPQGGLGSPVHASISGVVTEVRPDAILIEAK